MLRPIAVAAPPFPSRNVLFAPLFTGSPDREMMPQCQEGKRHENRYLECQFDQGPPATGH